MSALTRVLAVGGRAGLEVYSKSAVRYNSDRAAAGQALIEGFSDKIIGLGDPLTVKVR